MIEVIEYYQFLTEVDWINEDFDKIESFNIQMANLLNLSNSITLFS